MIQRANIMIALQKFSDALSSLEKAHSLNPTDENIFILIGQVKIILTTSRPEKLRKLTTLEMEMKGIPYDELIMGLPHCQRVVINDFAKSNPYPSATAINMPRNQDILKEFLS